MKMFDHCQYIFFNRHEFYILMLYDALFKGVHVHVSGVSVNHTNQHNLYYFVCDTFSNLSFAKRGGRWTTLVLLDQL